MGRKSTCRSCVSIYNKTYSSERIINDEEFRQKKIDQSIKWAKENPEKRALIAKRRNKKAILNNPSKIKARRAVNQRVRRGIIPRACELICQCGIRAAHYHHHLGYDFDVRLSVVPVCVKCHQLLG